jgi:hypothetical protein
MLFLYSVDLLYFKLFILPFSITQKIIPHTTNRGGYVQQHPVPESTTPEYHSDLSAKPDR